MDLASSTGPVRDAAPNQVAAECNSGKWHQGACRLPVNIALRHALGGALHFNSIYGIAEPMAQAIGYAAETNMARGQAQAVLLVTWLGYGRGPSQLCAPRISSRRIA